MKRNVAYLLIFLVLAVQITSFQGKEARVSSSEPETYFPSDSWREKSPGEVGMKASELNKIDTYIETYDAGIDSIHVIKDGYLCYERYYDYYDYSSIHQSWSVTKSIISLLVGIAEDEGFITDLDEPVLDIFTDRTFLNTDADKQSITIRHLLEMTSGIQWSETDYFSGPVNASDYDLITNTSDTTWDAWPFDPANIWYQTVHSSDWVQFVLDQPMESTPGTDFRYNTGASHLLSAIIENKTGMHTEKFAKQYLFAPLNITDYYWFNDTQGTSMGGSGLWLTPFDMTKIGYLCLNNGSWNGSQVVPASWIHDSTTTHAAVTGDRGYGYLWWTHNTLNLFVADGLGNQVILVNADNNLVAVMTAREYLSDDPYFTIMEDHVMNAIEVETASTTSVTTTTTPKTSSISGLIAFVGILMIAAVRRRRKSGAD